MDSDDWRTQLLLNTRQTNLNMIMETLGRHLPVRSQEGQEVQELRNIAVRFEEKVYTAATSQNDYLRKIALKMLTMETNYQNRVTNPLHPNAESSGPYAHGPEATSYETFSGPEKSDEEEEEEEDDGDMSKEDVVEDVVVSKEQNYVAGHRENVRVRENEVSCGLIAGAKLDDRLLQVEERLKKMEVHSEKVETLLVDSNEKLNYLMKMQDAKVSRDVKRPAEMTSSRASIEDWEEVIRQ